MFTKKQKVLLIYNPRAGKNSKRISVKKVLKLLETPDYDVTVKKTKHKGHATELAKEYGSKYDIVVCCGGDGTLSETINGVLQCKKPPKVGYIPMGSTNDYAETIGLPTSLEGAVGAIHDGHTNALDIGAFNDRFVSYIALFGPGASVSYGTPQKMKNLLGYTICATLFV